MEYRYKLSGIGKLDDKSLNKYKARILKIDGVADAIFDDEVCEIKPSEGAYEYDVLQTLIAISDDYSVEVVFGDEVDDNGLIDEDLEESDDDFIGENERDYEEETEKERQKASRKKAQVRQKVDDDIELDYNDGLSERKTALKKDSRFRIGELSVALILYVASLFFKTTDSVLSVKMILMILSFSVSGYDAVFNAGVDVYKKKFLSGNLVFLVASIALIVLGEPNVATALIWVFSAAKFVENYAKNKQAVKIEELFYTGTTPVSVDGEDKNRSEIEKGATIKLSKGNVVPTDGVLQTAGELSSYKVDRNLETNYFKGDKILAGSIVISDEITYVSDKKYGESFIDEKRESFDSSLSDLGSAKSEKHKKIGLYVDLLIIFASLAVTFILPIFSSTYKDGLYKWGVIGASLLTFACVSTSISTVIETYRNLYSEGFSSDIDYKDIEKINKLGRGNSLKVSAKALCDLTLDVKLKEDSIGALKELTALGVKKVSTDFDFELPETVKESLDFVEPKLNNEKQFSFYADKGDVSFNGDGVNVLNGEVSFVPLAYKMAKNTYKSAKTSTVLGILFKVIFIAGLFILPFNKFTVAYFAVGAAGVYLIHTLLSLAGFTKNK